MGIYTYYNIFKAVEINASENASENNGDSIVICRDKYYRISEHQSMNVVDDPLIYVKNLKITLNDLLKCVEIEQIKNVLLSMSTNLETEYKWYIDFDTFTTLDFDRESTNEQKHRTKYNMIEIIEINDTCVNSGIFLRKIKMEIDNLIYYFENDIHYDFRNNDADALKQQLINFQNEINGRINNVLNQFPTNQKV